MHCISMSNVFSWIHVIAVFQKNKWHYIYSKNMFVCEHIGTLYAGLLFPPHPWQSGLHLTHLLSITPLRLLLAFGLTCQSQIQAWGRSGTRLRNTAGCGCLLFTPSHLPLWWGRSEIKYEALTRRQMPFSANRIRWPCTHEINTYAELITILLILQIPPSKWPL